MQPLSLLPIEYFYTMPEESNADLSPEKPFVPLFYC